MRVVTPLRLTIAVGYVAFALVTVLFWQDIVNGWSLVMALATPVCTFLTALVALKVGTMLMALMSFLLACLSGAVTALITVSKLGVFKGVFFPWALSGIRWLCQKHRVLQSWVGNLYAKAKAIGRRIYSWWKSKPWIDRILLLGFIGPLIVVVSFVLLFKRTVYRFVSYPMVSTLVKTVINDLKRLSIIRLIGQGFENVKGRVGHNKHPSRRDEKQ